MGDAVDLSAAREFLARVVSWPLEPGDPWVNLHWKFQGDQPKPGWTGRAVRSVANAAKALEFADKGASTRDIYFCVSSQSEAVEKTSKAGFKYYTPLRLAENAVALKGFVMDLDVKEGAYASQRDAIAALGVLLAATGLPRPTMLVGSGSGGVHVWWTLTESIPREVWAPVAHALVAAALEHGLKFDTQCTTDAARIMRIPGTYNWKDGQKRPVVFLGKRLDYDYLLERIQTPLAKWVGAVRLPATQTPMMPQGFGQPSPLFANHKDTEFSAGVDTSPPLRDVSEITPHCAFIGEALTTGGKLYTNPMWNLTTLISTFLEDGRAQAHAMGCQHAGYTQDNTDAFFERKERERDERKLGWPLCATIAGTGFSGCSTCPHKSAGKSPLHLGNSAPVIAPPAASPSAVAQPAQPDILPPGYSRNPAGLVCKIIVQDDGTNAYAPVTDYPLKNGWLQSSPWTLNFTMTLRAGYEQGVHIATEDLSSARTMIPLFQRQGLFIQPHQQRIAQEFMMSWLKTLQEKRETVVESQPFGWVYDAGKIQGFAYGGSVHTPTGTRPAATPDPRIASQYTPAGALDVWQKAADMLLAQERPEMDVLLASAFAAPLMQFTNQQGLLVNAYSHESGAFKTTALQIAEAVWGHPKKAMQRLDDTENLLFKKAGTIRNLPLYWDEVKGDEQTKRFVNITFKITSGQEKGRLTASTAVQSSGDWATILVAASNDTIMDAISQHQKTTTAGLYRVFEFVVKKISSNNPGRKSPGAVAVMMGALHENFGRAGEVYAAWLGSNFTRVSKDVVDVIQLLEKQHSSPDEERFWIATMAILLLGAKYATEIGIAQFDMVRLNQFLGQTLRSLRKLVKAEHVDMNVNMNVTEVLGQYLSHVRAKHTLRTDRLHTGKGKPMRGSVRVVSEASRLEDLLVHIGEKDQIARMRTEPFHEWLRGKGYSRKVVIDALRREFTITDKVGVLGSGTDYATLPQHCIEFSLAGTELVDYAAR